MWLQAVALVVQRNQAETKNNLEESTAELIICTWGDGTVLAQLSVAAAEVRAGRLPGPAGWGLQRGPPHSRLSGRHGGRGTTRVSGSLLLLVLVKTKTDDNCCLLSCMF